MLRLASEVVSAFARRGAKADIRTLKKASVGFPSGAFFVGSVLRYGGDPLADAPVHRQGAYFFGIDVAPSGLIREHSAEELVVQRMARAAAMEVAEDRSAGEIQVADA